VESGEAPAGGPGQRSAPRIAHRASGYCSEMTQRTPSPMWLRQQPWIGAAITLCFGISFFGAFVSLLGAYALSNTN
jgi:hypothetical protein